MAKRILVLCAALLALVLLASAPVRTAVPEVPAAAQEPPGTTAAVAAEAVTETQSEAPAKPAPAEETAEPVQESPDTAEAGDAASMPEAQSAAAPDTGEPTAQELGEQLLSKYARTDGHITNEMRELLAEMSSIDPAAADRWTCLFETWEQVNYSMETNGSLGDAEIPEDDSLCIVVLGHQLLEYGSMSTELLSRLEVALACAEDYPNAYIAVSGGGSSEKNRCVTEADSMAAWLLEHGIAEERIIVENKSLTTGENACFTGELLKEQGIRAVILVTSDYHIDWCCMAFTAQSLFTDAGYRVVANRVFDTGKPENRVLYYQLMAVRSVLSRLENEETP